MQRRDTSSPLFNLCGAVACRSCQTLGRTLHRFTLDTNCIIAVDEQRPEAAAIHALADAHRRGVADVALVAISASERQRDGAMLDNFDQFTERVRSLGLDGLPLLLPMCYWDVMFWDACVEPESGLARLEEEIQAILFPSVPCSWQEYCLRKGFNPENAPLDKKWKNAKCDVQAFWCHASERREVFVTTDQNFHKTKKPRLLALAPGAIMLPDQAASLATHGAA